MSFLSLVINLLVNSGGSRISKRGCTNPLGGPTYYLTNFFFWKLHENEEILAPGEGVHF